MTDAHTLCVECSAKQIAEGERGGEKKTVVCLVCVCVNYLIFRCSLTGCALANTCECLFAFAGGYELILHCPKDDVESHSKITSLAEKATV